MIHSNKYCSQLDQLKEALIEKHPELVNRKCIIFHQVNVRPHVCLYGKTTIAWMEISDSSTVFTRHRTFRFPFILFTKILVEKISDPWKSVKGLERFLEQFFAQKDKKVLGRQNYEVA